MVKPIKTIAVLALSLAAAVSFHSEFLYFLLGFEGMVLLAAWFQCRYISRRVQLDAEIPLKTVTRQETFRVNGVLTNSSIFSTAQTTARLALQWFPEKEALLLTGKLSLGAGERGRLCFELDTPHCGHLDIWADKLTVTDSLGLFRRNCAVNVQRKYSLTVLPEIPDSTELLSSESAFSGEQGEAERRGIQEPDPAALRNYRPGDAMKQIHWKLYARLGELMVRETSEPGERLTWVYLHLGEKKEEPVRTNPDAWDAFVGKAAKIAASFLAWEIPHIVCWLDVAAGSLVHYRVTRPDEMITMLCALLRAETFPDRDVSQLLREIRLDETKGTCIEIDLQGNSVHTKE